MATTSVTGKRGQGTAMERFPDAVFMRDNKLFYLGTDGDFSMNYNGTRVVFAGADVAFSDTQKLELGDTDDFSMSFDATRVVWAGADVMVSDTQKLMIGESDMYFVSSTDASAVSDSVCLFGIPTSDSGVAGALYTVDGSDLHITPYS